MDKSEFIRRLQAGFNNATAAPRMTEAEIRKKAEEDRKMLEEEEKRKEKK